MNTLIYWWPFDNARAHHKKTKFVSGRKEIIFGIILSADLRIQRSLGTRRSAVQKLPLAHVMMAHLRTNSENCIFCNQLWLMIYETIIFSHNLFFSHKLFRTICETFIFFRFHDDPFSTRPILSLYIFAFFFVRFRSESAEWVFAYSTSEAFCIQIIYAKINFNGHWSLEYCAAQAHFIAFLPCQRQHVNIHVFINFYFHYFSLFFLQPMRFGFAISQTHERRENKTIEKKKVRDHSPLPLIE